MGTLGSKRKGNVNPLVKRVSKKAAIEERFNKVWYGTKVPDEGMVDKKTGYLVLTKAEFVDLVDGDSWKIEKRLAKEYLNAAEQLLVDSWSYLDVLMYKAGYLKPGPECRTRVVDFMKAVKEARVGKCPWCKCDMLIGDEDAMLERMCDTCAIKTERQLKKLNPKFWARFEKASSRIYGFKIKRKTKA